MVVDVARSLLDRYREEFESQSAGELHTVLIVSSDRSSFGPRLVSFHSGGARMPLPPLPTDLKYDQIIYIKKSI
jgi:hypothetical protein